MARQLCNIAMVHQNRNCRMQVQVKVEERYVLHVDGMKRRTLVPTFLTVTLVLFVSILLH